MKLLVELPVSQLGKDDLQRELRAIANSCP
jgi:hypothetical protein